MSGNDVLLRNKVLLTLSKELLEANTFWFDDEARAVADHPEVDADIFPGMVSFCLGVYAGEKS